VNGSAQRIAAPWRESGSGLENVCCTGNGEAGGCTLQASKEPRNTHSSASVWVWESEGEEVDGDTLRSRTALEAAAGLARDALAEI
jgi:hypothetical protein